MAVVIRLQGLRSTAGPEDIRNFFSGLKIPDGGVHIIGGELDEAFIIFMSDEDARRAMIRSGGCIKGSPINLLLSSKSEMQNLLEESTRRSEQIKRGLYKEPDKRSPMEKGPMGFVKDTRIDGRKVDHQEVRGRSSTSSQRSREGGVSDRDEFYLKMTGLPFSATPDDVTKFFDGIHVDEILFLKNARGSFSGHCMALFYNKENADDALRRNRFYMGPRYILITRCSKEEWLKEGGPAGPQRSPHHRARSRSPISYRSGQRSPVSYRSGQRSPVSYRSGQRSPTHDEYCVLIDNLPFTAEKRDLRLFLQAVPLMDDQIIIFSPKRDERSKSAVLVFRSLTDYCSCLARNKEMMYNKIVYISPISKEEMVRLFENSVDPRRENREMKHSDEESHSMPNHCDSELRCMYIRNLPLDARKVEIIHFFHGFGLSEDRIILLRDERGGVLGEALVVFQSEREALAAQSLNGKICLGSALMLKCITMAQMEQIGLNEQVPERNFDRADSFHGRPQMPQENFEMQPDFHHGNNPVDFGGPGPDGGGHQYYESQDQQFEGPNCVKLVNLPSQIRIEEIYDFCYGYKVIPGSATLLFDKHGAPMRAAIIAFQTHREALVAVNELNGRPIGTRNIKVFFV